MRYIKMLILIYLFVVFPALTVEAEDLVDDYHTYVEIIMNTGKLMKNFTDEDVKEFYKKSEGIHFFKICVEPIYVNVDATYISNTLFSVDNRSKTDVDYEVDVAVETNNKISFSMDGSLSAAGSSTIKKVKAEASAKNNIGFNASTSKSIKEKKSTKIKVEANSRAIIYLIGDMSVTNGVIVVYRWFYKAYLGGYEFVTLKSQYAKIEKRSIDSYEGA